MVPYLTTLSNHFSDGPLATRPDPEADGGSLPGLSADFEALRWFVLPRECLPG